MYLMYFMGDKSQTHVNISDNVSPLKVGSSGLEESVRINQFLTPSVSNRWCTILKTLFLTFAHYCHAFVNLKLLVRLVDSKRWSSGLLRNTRLPVRARAMGQRGRQPDGTFFCQPQLVGIRHHQRTLWPVLRRASSSHSVFKPRPQ